GSPATAAGYANNLQTSIRIQDGRAPVGWIVDLRGAAGVNMWPMIAGLGPVLGEGTLGYFVDPDGAESVWQYLAGTATLNDSVTQAVATPYTLASDNPRVAVLTDGRVAGWGEAVVIAFKGRPNTRYFGEATCGLSTATSSFGVAGAVLFLTVADLADRSKGTYGGALLPDEAITIHTELRERAIAWLRGE
ncbi:MAG TPA: S41 family peptidase, partial [Gemmatimonadaceae bacterium]